MSITAFLRQSRPATTKYTIGYLSLRMMMGLQLTLLQEGHHLRLWWKGHPEGTERQDGMGVQALFPEQITICDTPEEAVTGANFWFSDYMNEDDFDEEDLAAINPYYVNTSELANVLEQDRKAGKVVAETWCGLQVPPEGQTFYSKGTLLNYLDTRLAIDNDGGIALKGKHNTALAHSLLEAKALLNNVYFEETDWPLSIEQLLPENDSLELAFGGFFNGKDYFGHVLLTHEYKGCNNNNRGSVLTGEIGTALIWVKWERMPFILQSAFMRLKPALISSGYRGFLDFNTIISQTNATPQINFLEFTCRPGYPTEFEIAAYWTQTSQYGEWLAAVASLVEWPSIKDDAVIGLGAALFATGNGIDVEQKLYHLELPLLNLLDTPLVYRQRDDCSLTFMPCDLRYVPEIDQLMTTDWDRALFLVTWQRSAWISQLPLFLGNCFQRLRHEANLFYTLDRLRIWGHTYRDDIGSRFSLPDTWKLLDQLQTSIPLPITQAMSRVGYRNLDQRDIGELYWLEHNAGFTREEAYNLGQFQDILETGQCTWFYIRNEKQAIIAYALVLPGEVALAHEASWWSEISEQAKIAPYLDNLVVHPHYRKSGLARQLLAEIAKEMVPDEILRLHCRSGLEQFYLGLTANTVAHSDVFVDPNATRVDRYEIFLYVGDLNTGGNP